MSASLAAAIRYAAFYGAVFLGLGIYLPFWPVWLGSRGLAPEEIGLLFALASWIRVATSPAIGHFADRARQPRTVVAFVAAVSAACFAALTPLSGFWAILLLTLPAAITLSALMPLSEAQTMKAVVRDGLDYGRIRLWGSLAFVVGTIGTGTLLSGRTTDLILVLMVAAMVAAFATALCLPRQPPLAAAGAPLRVLPLLADRRFLLFLAAASLLMASHGAYYGFSALHWRAAGLSDSLIGWLWAEGVLAEVAFFAISTAVLARVSPTSLLIFAGCAGILRWTLLAATTDLTALVLAQLLHAATFSAMHLGAMHFIARAAPQGLAATAQSVYEAASGGFGLGLALLLAGILFGLSGAHAFLAMAVLSAGGMALAIVLHRRTRTTAVGTGAGG